MGQIIRVERDGYTVTYEVESDKGGRCESAFRCDPVIGRAVAALPALLEACKAALAYDNAIARYAETGRVAVRGDGSGDATGADLDAAYELWLSAARTALAIVEGS